MRGALFGALCSAIADDAYEENDSLASAYDLSAEEGIWLSSLAGLAVQADEDWFWIEVGTGEERVPVDCNFTHAEGNIKLGLFDVSGT